MTPFAFKALRLHSYGLPTLQIIYIITSTTGTDNWGAERTLASIPALYATSMILPKFSHMLGIDVGIIPGLDANKKVTDSGISNKPICMHPHPARVSPSHRSRPQWQQLDVPGHVCQCTPWWMSSLPSGHLAGWNVLAQYDVHSTWSVLMEIYTSLILPLRNHYPANSLKCNILHLLPFGITFHQVPFCWFWCFRV